MTSFFIRISFLLLPGIIGRMLYTSLIGKKPKKEWEEFFEILIFSLVTYIIYANLCSLFTTGEFITEISIFNKILNEEIPIQWEKIYPATGVAIIIALIASAFHTYKIINKFGRLINVTKRYGDEDLWDLFHNTPNIEWVVIRDHKLDLAYFCYEKYVSDLGSKRELILKDVEVFNNSGEFLYKADAMYIARDDYDLTIEVPDFKESNRTKRSDIDA